MGWSHLRNIGVLVFRCVCVCRCKHVCHEFCAHCFREKRRKKERKKKKRIFVRSTRLERGGEVMATGRRESTRLLCCSLLLVVSVVQLLATGQWSETLCQGALTGLDSRIEPQQVAGHVALIVLEPRPPPLCFTVILPSQNGNGVPLAE